MLKKAVIVAMSILIVGILSSCVPKYGDLNDVYGKIVESTENLIKEVDIATDGRGVANALSSYADSYIELSRDMRRILEKYPELKNAAEAPKELKANFDKINDMGEKLMTTMTKLQVFADDPDVMNAVQKMTAMQLE
jgi:hypothetical protein